MLSNLQKNLSKTDAIHLLDITFETLHGKSKEDLESIYKKLMHLIPFDRILAANASIIMEKNNPELSPNPRVTAETFGIAEEFELEYIQQKKYLIDPIAKELFLTLDLVDFYELQKKDISLLKSPVHRLFQEYNIHSGFSYLVTSFDNIDATAFSFYYYHKNIKTDPRIAVIGKYIVPFMAELYKRILGLTKQPNTLYLTQREKEILRWLKEGKSSWEISMILNIGESTVNFHITNIMRKLNATRRAQAVAVALNSGLIEF